MTKYKTIVITGASTGIGAATAKLFAAHHYKVYNLDYKVSASNCTLIENMQCDVSKLSQLQAAFDQIMQKESELNCLFANAGVFLSKPIEDTTEDEINRIVDINLKGQMFALKCAITIMKKQSTGGKIVLMGSDTCFIGKPSMPVYGSTKGGVAMLTKNVAIDCAKYHISVNAVCPGPILTPIFQRWVDETKLATGKTEKEIIMEFAKCLPAGRIGTPEEVAKIVQFLCSDASDFMVGSLVSIDGGSTCQ